MTSTGPSGASRADQVPPTSSTDALEAWLAGGAYKAWRCESAPHSARANSGHQANRVCNNAAITAGQSGPFPAGAASVKELWSSDGARVSGYAVGVHTGDGSAASSWYWYERLWRNAQGPSSGDTVYVGQGLPVCNSCHVQAGVGGRTGHDNVYTIVDG